MKDSKKCLICHQLILVGLDIFKKGFDGFLRIICNTIEPKDVIQYIKKEFHLKRKFSDIIDTLDIIEDTEANYIHRKCYHKNNHNLIKVESFFDKRTYASIFES